MKILHVCSNYFPAFGGPQYTMKHLSENLVNIYHDEVEVATTNSLYGPEMQQFQAIEPHSEMINGVAINRFPFHRWQYPFVEFAGRVYKKIMKQTLPHALNKYRWELACNGIEAAMKNTDAEVIMATTSKYMFSDYPFWRFKTKNPKPFILYGSLHLHINWPQDAAVIKRARACDCYIANTNFEKNKLLDYDVEKSKIVTIGTGINVEEYICEPADIAAFREKYHVGQEDILIGHIGRLSPGKGAGILLDAFQLLYKKNNRCKLLLAGTSTPFTENLQKKIRAEKLPVIILEDFENALKPVLFNAIDIFVLASAGESFGVVFLEAWACKKSVIGAETGAIADLIDDGNDGLLFTPGDATSLLNQLEKLSANKLLQTELGEAGFRKTTQKFSWPVITKKYRDAYLQGIENFNTKVGR